jgi:hypothetical protein
MVCPQIARGNGRKESTTKHTKASVEAAPAFTLAAREARDEYD